MKTKHPPRVRKEVLLLSADMVACAVSLWLALHLRFGGAIPTAHQLPYQGFLPILIGLRLLAALGFGLYDFRRKLTASDHAFSGCAAALAGVGSGYTVLVLARLYYTNWIDVSRWVACFDTALLTLWFAGSRAVVISLLTRLGYQVRAVLVGPREVCDRLRDEIQRHAPPLFAVCGALEPEDARFDSELDRLSPDQAILTSLSVVPERLYHVLSRLDEGNVETYVYPDLTLSVVANARITSIAGIPLAPLTPGAGAYRLGKRALDVAVAAVGLVLAVPLGSIVAAGIALTSAGPVLYRQERVGLRGQRFSVLKFRTMTLDAEAGSGPVLAVEDDPRVTRVGRALRRFRVDELPQLWNVLKGDMSLVGPRPERPEFVSEFVTQNPLYERRSLVKPGLTGLAQIHGRYDSSPEQKLRYDLVYLNSVSLSADLRILASTVRIVITGKGAR